MSRQRSIAAIIAGTLFACVADPASAQLDYTLTAGIIHNDNINLDDANPISDTILSPGLGFNYRNDGATVQANINGTLQFLHYLGGRFGDTTRSQLAGRVNWELLPQRLTWSFADNLAVQPINELQPDVPSNQQQTNVFATGPTLLFSLGPSMRGQAELRYAVAHASKTPEFDSKRTSAALRAIKDSSAISQWSANLQAQQVNFDHASALAPDYDRYDIYAGYTHKLAHLTIDVAAGYTKLRLHGDGADKGGPLLRGALAWQASARSTFNVTAARQFTDAADALSVAPGAIAAPPTNIATGDASVSPQTFLQRRVDIGYRFEDVRLGWSLAPYYFKREYSDGSQLDERGSGARAELDYKLRPRLGIGVHADYAKSRYAALDASDRNATFGASVNYQLTEKLAWHLDLSHYRRSSDVFDNDATQNVIYFWVAWSR